MYNYFVLLFLKYQNIQFSIQGLSANFNDGSGITLCSSSSLSINVGYVGMFAISAVVAASEGVIRTVGECISSG